MSAAEKRWAIRTRAELRRAALAGVPVVRIEQQLQKTSRLLQTVGDFEA